MNEALTCHASCLFVLLLAQVGCQSTREIERAADSADRFVGEVQAEIRAKINAENEYYSETINAIRGDVDRARETDVVNFVTRGARTFVKAHRPNADPASLDKKLQDYLAKAVVGWKKREASRRKTLNNVIKRLSEGRQKIELEEAKIKSLRAKLRILSKPKSTSEVLKYLVSFTKGVTSQIKQRREEGDT